MKAFVVMPFSDSVAENLYRLSIKPVCKKVDLIAERADEMFSANPVIEDILSAIESAKVIIADITGRNANVFYELGISHTLKRGQTIMITRDHYEDVPFDVGHFRIIKYQDTISGKASFEHNLEQTLRMILQDPRVHKTDEFAQVVRLFRILDRGGELGSMVARRSLAHSPEIGSTWWYELADQGGTSETVAIYDYGTFRGMQAMGYVEFADKTINFTPTGEAFADYLIQSGFRCLYINGKSLEKGHKPSAFIRKHEATMDERDCNRRITPKKHGTRTSTKAR